MDDPKRPTAADAIAPGFVAAMPQLDDPNFQRSVVFLLASDERGAFGIVINRPSAISLAQLCEGQEVDYRGPNDLPLMIGGPVETDSHLLVLHGDAPLFGPADGNEVVVAPGVYVVTAREGLERLARSGTSRMRCFAGYSGWGPGQLEGELAEGSWVPLTVDPKLLFAADPDDVWERALRESGIDPISLVPGGQAN